MAAMGIGSIVGVVTMALRDSSRGLARIFIVSSAASAILLGAFALTTAFWPAVALMSRVLVLRGLEVNIAFWCSEVMCQGVIGMAHCCRPTRVVGVT